ncbi:hypothetical protein ACFLQN_00345 [Candidatus Aenigmatarchaeota archaeon]
MKKLIKMEIILIILIIIFGTSFVLINENEKEDKYEESIILGAEWFLNNQDENFIYYRYDPQNELYPAEHHPLREAASLWSIADSANFLGDERLTRLSEKGFQYFEKYFGYNSEYDYYYLDITPGNVKLGYSAFIILALLEMEHPRKETYLNGFANGIVYLQNDDGSLGTYFFSNKSTGQDYYPGEALFAIMSLYEYNGDEKYLEVTQKAFPHYRDYWRGNKNTAFVPWQSRAYNKLYKVTEDQEVSDFVFEMNDWMLQQHHPEGLCEKYDFSRGVVTGVYLEGVIQAYELAEITGDNERKKCYKNFIIEGLDATILLQITEGTKEAIGGFVGTDGTVRVDRNQHALFALIEAIELGII